MATGNRRCSTRESAEGSALYASEDVTASVVLPGSYAAPGMPPVLDQHATPMCVAYSSWTPQGRLGHG